MVNDYGQTSNGKWTSRYMVASSIHRDTIKTLKEIGYSKAEALHYGKTSQYDVTYRDWKKDVEILYSEVAS